jgi:hypothetical protein
MHVVNAQQEEKMEPLKIHVTKVIDFGTIVSIVGTDIESQLSVVVHVDHRPFQIIWDAWQKAGFPQPVTFGADGLTLNLAFDSDEDGDSNDVEHVHAA